MKFLKYALFLICLSLLRHTQSLSVNENMLNRQKVPTATSFLQKGKAEARTGCVDEDNTKFIIGCEKEVKEACAEKVHTTHIESKNCLFITENDCFEKGFTECKQIIIFFDESMGSIEGANIVPLIPQNSIFDNDQKAYELPADYLDQAFIALKNSNGENMEVHTTSEMKEFREALVRKYEEQKQAQMEKADQTTKDNVHDQIVQKAVDGITSGVNYK